MQACLSAREAEGLEATEVLVETRPIDVPLGLCDASQQSHLFCEELVFEEKAVQLFCKAGPCCRGAGGKLIE